MTKNLLDQETSPYLLQHKDNPVHWQPWSKQTLERARQLNKPILLSVGYSACHWCHVMAHESFEDPVIASLMNELFINIKVDREERPDLDSVFQKSLNLMGQHGGWPLTMFLNSDGQPFWGGTYFPPQSSYGRPGFSHILNQISHIYQQQRDTVHDNVSRIMAALQDQQNNSTSSNPSTLNDGGLNSDKISHAAQAAMSMIDIKNGGTQGAPKFPQPVFMKFLWQEYLLKPQPELLHAVCITLDNICQGGIYDHLGGGLARYSVDNVWLVPHFEKMLYDNALFIDLLAEVWKQVQSPLYEQRVVETIDWMVSDLRIDQGDVFGLASARDADSEGVEGKFYVWDKSDVDQILGDDADLFCKIYNISQPGNWEGVNIAFRNVTPETLTQNEKDILAHCREKLLNVRKTRIHPLRDDKVLADWNGLSITALVHCSGVFDQPKWQEHGEKIYGFIKSTLFQNGRLSHCWCKGVASQNGVLDDYANMARAALALFQATTQTSYLEDACELVEIINTWFWDKDHGDYFLSAVDTDDIFLRPKVTYDNPTPSGNGVMVEVLARLFVLTGKPDYEKRARQTLAALCPATPHELINQPSLSFGYEILSSCAQVVIVIDESEDPARHPLYKSALRTAPMNYVISHTTPGQAGQDMAADHPAFAKGLHDGLAAAYVCRNRSCSLPITDTEKLADILSTIG